MTEIRVFIELRSSGARVQRAFGTLVPSFHRGEIPGISERFNLRLPGPCVVSYLIHNSRNRIRIRTGSKSTSQGLDSQRRLHIPKRELLDIPVRAGDTYILGKHRYVALYRISGDMSTVCSGSNTLEQYGTRWECTGIVSLWWIREDGGIRDSAGRRRPKTQT